MHSLDLVQLHHKSISLVLKYVLMSKRNQAMFHLTNYLPNRWRIYKQLNSILLSSMQPVEYGLLYHLVFKCSQGKTKKWRVYHLTWQFDSLKHVYREDVKAKTYIPMRQTTFAYYKICKLQESEHDPSKLTITKLSFVSKH